MTAITYTATRNISSGHSASTEYQLECEMVQLDPSIQAQKQRNQSQGGNAEVILHRIDTGYSFKSSYIEDTDKAVWDEFLHSVAGGESFVFDAFGTIASADNEETVVMIGSPTWNRASHDAWQVAFKMDVL